jgi:hypothetical protein
MLADHPVDVMLLITDLEVARRFYGDTLGLPVLVEDTQFLTFGCGGDSRLVVTKSTTGTREAVTKASWRVEDLAGEVAWLRAQASRSRNFPSWAPSTASPTSGSPWRPGSSTRTTTGSACSNSKIPVFSRAAPQPAPDVPLQWQGLHGEVA